MEILIFLNGLLFAFNALFLIKSGRKQVKVKQIEPTAEERKDKRAEVDQYANMMTYNGSVQGGARDED
jgi:hypothetical protein